MHGVHAAIGQADIVKDVVELTGGDLLTDGLLDQVTETGCLLDPESRLPANMQNEVAAIGARKEVLAKPRHQHECREADQKEERHKTSDEQTQSWSVTDDSHDARSRIHAQRRAENAKTHSRRQLCVLRLQQIHSQSGYQRAGQDIGGKHRKDHRLGEGNKQIAGYAAKKEHGKEDDTDAECRDQGRH